MHLVVSIFKIFTRATFIEFEGGFHLYKHLFMKNIILLILSFTVLIQFLSAQFSVRLVVTEVATKKDDDIYVSGTFNNWNPKDINYKLKPFAGGRKSIVLKDVASGNYAYKFTRGSFDKVECMADGREINDRLVDVSSDVSVDIKIAGWKDDYPERPKRYTASPQVKVIDTAFYIPELKRKRRIWVYLPKGYTTSEKKYPVLYMQDGQNLFNEQTAAFGEWGVDECLDSLQKIIQSECIVVGIDNGGDKRVSEYCPYDYSLKNTFSSPDSKGEGKDYVAFLVNSLKPYIDSKFRTMKGREYTYIAGSSMGGLISEYAILKYPDVFGAAGIFSPSFWIAPSIFEEASNSESKELSRFYIYGGGKESNTMVSDIEKMYEVLGHKKRYEIARLINPIGEHNEKFWKEAFPAFFIWLMRCNRHL